MDGIFRGGLNIDHEYCSIQKPFAVEVLLLLPLSCLSWVESDETAADLRGIPRTEYLISLVCFDLIRNVSVCRSAENSEFGESGLEIASELLMLCFLLAFGNRHQQ